MVTRPDAPSGRGRRLTPSPVAQRAEELGVPVLKPDHPRDPEFQAALRELRPDCCPVVAYGALLPAERPRHPRARLGQPALLVPARLARRGAGAARDLGGRRGDRRDHVPDRQGDGRRPDVRRDDRADPRHRHRRRPAGPARRGRRRAARGHPRRHRGRQPGGPARSRPRAPATRPRSPSTTPSVDWAEPAAAVDRRIRACTPAPGAWTTYDGERVKLGPGRPHRGARWRRASCGSAKTEVLVGTGTTAVRLGEVKAFGARQMPAADWARGLRLPATARFDSAEPGAGVE